MKHVLSLLIRVVFLMSLELGIGYIENQFLCLSTNWDDPIDKPFFILRQQTHSGPRPNVPNNIQSWIDLVFFKMR